MSASDIHCATKSTRENNNEERRLARVVSLSETRRQKCSEEETKVSKYIHKVSLFGNNTTQRPAISKRDSNCRLWNVRTPAFGRAQNATTQTPGPGLGEKCPGGTTRLPEAEEEEVGHFSNVPCQEKEVSVRTKEEDGNAKEGVGSNWERKSQQGNQRQAEAAFPGDVETLAQKGELHLGHGDTRQPRRETLTGEDGGRGSAGAGHVLGRMWPEQVRSAYWGMGWKGGKTYLSNLRAQDK
ncbi:hypothetical protein NDU88_003112 [Pleurodeles waltl]|uniref:Uncharacterized protein n=1 Tax=Pleurodeles waltl TaxID=8319 RepID=A0AAV7UZ37_PLEWA|nr:hypothetical protein NDU88_003112 [Pleurodeles waltl]